LGPLARYVGNHGVGESRLCFKACVGDRGAIWPGVLDKCENQIVNSFYGTRNAPRPGCES
jgi:hypothetical protein